MNEIPPSSALTSPILIPDIYPKDLTILVLSYLDLEELNELRKRGEPKVGDKRLLGGLVPLLPKVTIISERFWQREEFSAIQIDTSDAIPMGVNDKEVLIPVLAKLLPLVEGDAGITLLTIPKGLSFNKLITLGESLAGKYGEIFRYIWEDFKNTFGNIEVDKTYTVVITNNILLGSGDKKVQAQKKLVAELEVGCDFPKVIEMVTLL